MYARCSVVKSHIQGTEANVGFCQQQCTKLQKNKENSLGLAQIGLRGGQLQKLLVLNI